MVREHDVRREVRTHGCDVLRDVVLALGAREVLQELRLEPFVTIEHEHRQRPVEVRTHDVRAAEVVLARVRVLTERDHVVPCAAPFACERARVDVRPCPAEQVPVPEQDSHPARRYVK